MSHSLICKNLQKQYGGRTVVDGVSFQVESGEIVGLLGPNGAGKTTSFYMAIGLVKPEGGQIFIDDKEITAEPMYIRAREGLTYLPQECSVFRKLTVQENILAILEILPEYQGDRRKQVARLNELIDELSLQKVEKNIAYSLSGGERRRVEIARALACSPKFILLDEPFAGIDPIVVGDLQLLVRALKEKEIGILITDHNVRETLSICDHAYILTDGHVVERGTPEEIVNSEIARKYYLGDNFSM